MRHFGSQNISPSLWMTGAPKPLPEGGEVALQQMVENQQQSTSTSLTKAWPLSPGLRSFLLEARPLWCFVRWWLKHPAVLIWCLYLWRHHSQYDVGDPRSEEWIDVGWDQEANNWGQSSFVITSLPMAGCWIVRDSQTCFFGWLSSIL